MPWTPTRIVCNTLINLKYLGVVIGFLCVESILRSFLIPPFHSRRGKGNTAIFVSYQRFGVASPPVGRRSTDSDL